MQSLLDFTSGRLLSRTWLVIFATICAGAFLVRENGILLPVVLFPALLARAVKGLRSAGKILDRIQSVFLLLVPYSIPVLAVGIIYMGFSSYNYLHYGHFQIGIHQKSHHFLVKTLYTANFDPRSLLIPASSISQEATVYLGLRLYSSYILAKDQFPKLDPIYTSLYPTVNQEMEKPGLAVNPFNIASNLDEIGKNSNSFVSWKANFAGLLRKYKALISLDVGSYPLKSGYPATSAQKQEWLSQISKNLTYEEKSSDSRRNDFQIF